MTSTHTMHSDILTATCCTIFSIWKLKAKSPLNSTHTISMRLNREQQGTMPKSLASQICFPACSLSSFRRDHYKRRDTRPNDLHYTNHIYIIIYAIICHKVSFVYFSSQDFLLGISEKIWCCLPKNFNYLLTLMLYETCMTWKVWNTKIIYFILFI